MTFLILVLSIINFLFGILILMQSRRENRNFAFLLFAIVASMWTFSNFYLRVIPTEFSLRVVYLLGALTVLTGLIWVYSFLNKTVPWYVKFVLLPLQIILVWPTLFTGQVIEVLYVVKPLGFEGIVGRSIILYSMIFATVVSLSLYELARAYLIEKNRERQIQILYVFIGMSLFTLIAFTVNFVLPQALKSFAYVTLDNLSISIFLVFIVIAILRYKLFSLKVLATELFVVALWSFLLIQMFFSENRTDVLINSALLGLTIIIGIFLIRSVINEVKQREQIEELVNRLTSANDQLAVANFKLKDLDKLKTEFVSLATHQIRGPIGAIKGYSSMMLDGDFGNMEEELKDPIDRVLRSSNSLALIVNDFLNISRIEQGRMKYDNKNFDLSALVTEVVSELTPTIVTKGLVLKSKIQPKVTVFADQGKIKQVIGNLLDNSVRFTSNGQINISLLRKNKKVRFSVKDTGVGITKETMSRLFEKFSRAKDAARTDTMGTGLGLYVAKELVEAHGGKIWAESEGKDKGSEFIFELDDK